MKEKHFELYFKSSLAFKKLHVEYINRLLHNFDDVVANASYDLDGVIHIYAISLYDGDLENLEEELMKIYSPLLNNKILRLYGND